MLHSWARFMLIYEDFLQIYIFWIWNYLLVPVIPLNPIEISFANNLSKKLHRQKTERRCENIPLKYGTEVCVEPENKNLTRLNISNGGFKTVVYDVILDFLYIFKLVVFSNYIHQQLIERQGESGEEAGGRGILSQQLHFYRIP